MFNPSDTKGGTLKLAISADWDSLDPGDTYYGFSWNFLRLYGRTLLMFKPVPGSEGARARPDLAEGLGMPSDGGKTWTYKLKPGVKYEDGTPITSKDVKYARAALHRQGDVCRTARRTSSDFLDLPEGYKGPYKSKDVNTDSAIETPDDTDDRLPPEDSRSAASTTSAQLPQTVPVPEGQGHRRQVQGARDLVRPVQVRADTSQGKNFTLVRNTELGPGDRPEPQGAAGPLRGPAQRQRRRHRQPAASPATSTSTWPAPACSRPRWAGSSATRP